MYFVSEFIDPVKTAKRPCVHPRDVVAVIGKLLARAETRRFTDDFVALNYELTSVPVLQHPFASQQRDHAIRPIADGDEIDERMRFVLRQTFAAVMVHELVEMSG